MQVNIKITKLTAPYDKSDVKICNYLKKSKGSILVEFTYIG